MSKDRLIIRDFEPENIIMDDNSYWNLTISREQFRTIYKGLDIDESLFDRLPDTEEEYMKHASSKLWRMNNWYKVVNKDGDLVNFIMNYAQHKVYARQLRHSRSIILKSRQRGISTFFLINYFDDAITLDNLAVGMQSYGLEESATLLEKLTVAWENMSEYNKKLLGIGLTKNNTKAMGFTNGSQIKVATSFRGTTLHRLHVSELGKIANKDPKKARELKTGTLQAIKEGNPAAIESTAEGRYNAFFDWWYTAVDHIGDRALKDFDPVFLSWVDDPDCTATIMQDISYDDELALEKIEAEWAEYAGMSVCDCRVAGDYADGKCMYPNDHFSLTLHQKWWYVASMRELGDKFHQEYPHTPESAFDSARDGSYYARKWRREGHVWDSETAKKFGRERLYDDKLEVHTAWDLGRNDMMVIVFFQVVGQEIRIIDEYHNNGEDLSHYTNMLWERAKDKGYGYGRHVFPHDVKVTDLSSPVSRLSLLRKLGVKKTKVLRRTKDVNTDIEHVRAAIPHMWIDPGTAGYILKMMSRYSKKWDEVLGTFKDTPLHDEWSNPADAIRYAVMAKFHEVKTPYENSNGEAIEHKTTKRSRSNVVDGMAF